MPVEKPQILTQCVTYVHALKCYPCPCPVPGADVYKYEPLAPALSPFGGERELFSFGAGIKMHPSLRGVETHLVDDRGVIVRHGRDCDADEPHARRGEFQPVAGSAECVFALVTKRFPMGSVSRRFNDIFVSGLVLVPKDFAAVQIGRFRELDLAPGIAGCVRIGVPAPGLVPVN